MRRLPIFSALLFILAAVPYVASAASATFFGPIVPDGKTPGQPNCNCPEGGAAGMGCVLATIQNAMNFGISISIIIAVLAIAYAGFLFIMSVNNPESRSAAKSALSNAFIGILIVLAAWLVVDFVMKAIYNPDAGFGAWESILSGKEGTACIIATGTKPLTDGSTSSGGGGLSTGGGGGNSTGGSCTVQSSGACAASNFTSAFGTAANEASMICSAESCNGACTSSGVDLALPSRKPVSFGIFQINITAHKVAGLDCPSAFSAMYTSRNHDVAILNPVLYEKCKAAALDTTNNMAVAKSIYQSDGGSWRQWGTRAKCGLSLGDARALAACFTTRYL